LISHKHKCIFIHIPKCAGSSIEKGFGVRPDDFTKPDYEHLMGWCPEKKIYMHHATPQQLFDMGFIDSVTWNSYYKFVIYRNSYDRAFSDYKYLLRMAKTGSFEDYLNRRNEFHDILTDTTSTRYRGDHLTLQKEYFFLNGSEIKYDTVVDFDFVQSGLAKVIADLGLPQNCFDEKINVSSEKKAHYSLFYNEARKQMVDVVFAEDIAFFKFSFDDRKSFIDKLLASAASRDFLIHYTYISQHKIAKLLSIKFISYLIVFYLKRYLAKVKSMFTGPNR